MMFPSPASALLRPQLCALLVAASLMAPVLAAVHENGLPSYHYGAPIRVECMNRSSCVYPSHAPHAAAPTLSGHLADHLAFAPPKQ